MAIPIDENNRSTWVEMLGVAGSGALRLSLLFGSAAIALTIILTPMAESEAMRVAANQTGLDQIATGATQGTRRLAPSSQSYTIRRSVLQSDRSDVCIISATGLRTGTC
jgi:hypothetical protein